MEWENIVFPLGEGIGFSLLCALDMPLLDETPCCPCGFIALHTHHYSNANLLFKVELLTQWIEDMKCKLTCNLSFVFRSGSLGCVGGLILEVVKEAVSVVR